jgi:hypothetical protein
VFAGAVSCRALAQCSWLGLGLLLPRAGLSYRKTKTDNLATLKRQPRPDQTSNTTTHALISRRVVALKAATPTPTLLLSIPYTTPASHLRLVTVALLARLLACSPRFPAAHLDPATPTSINNQAQRRRSIVNTSLHTFFTPQHPTRLHSLPPTRGSRSDGQRCSQTALSPTSH